MAGIRIVFDFDGTIADSLPLSHRLLNEQAAKHGWPPLSMEELRELNKEPIAERLRRMGIPMIKVPLVLPELLAEYRKRVGTVRPVTGIRSTVRRLREEGYRLSILSSNTQATIEHWLRLNELEAFDEVLSSGLFGKPAALKRLVRQNRLKFGELIYIGDEYRDLEACRKAGVRMIAATWGYDDAELLRRGRPDAVADSPKAILELLRKWQKDLR